MARRVGLFVSHERRAIRARRLIQIEVQIAVAHVTVRDQARLRARACAPRRRRDPRIPGSEATGSEMSCLRLAPSQLLCLGNGLPQLPQRFALALALRHGRGEQVASRQGVAENTFENFVERIAAA